MKTFNAVCALGLATVVATLVPIGVHAEGQARSVSSDDWAYDALQAMIEEHQCASWITDSVKIDTVFSGSQAQKIVKDCIDDVNDLLEEGRGRDLTPREVRRAGAILFEVAGLTDGINVRAQKRGLNVADLAKVDSFANKLRAEALFHIADTFEDDEVADEFTTFGGRVRLNLTSSFSGKDEYLAHMKSKGQTDPFEHLFTPDARTEEMVGAIFDPALGPAEAYVPDETVETGLYQLSGAAALDGTNDAPTSANPNSDPKKLADAQDQTLGKYRLSIGAIYLNNVNHDFTGFDQRLLDDPSYRNLTVNLGLRVDTPFFADPQVNTYLGGEIMHLDADYNGHINISTGAPGPSNGSIRHTYVGAYAQFEFPVNERGSIGISPGLGMLFPNVSGTFEVDDPVFAAKGELYYLHQVNETFGLSAGVFAIVPFGDSRGGVTGGPRSDVDIAPITGITLKGILTF